MATGVTRQPYDTIYCNTHLSTEELNKFRKSMGLGPISKGKVFCLYCNQTFESIDTKKNRICVKCKYSKERING